MTGKDFVGLCCSAQACESFLHPIAEVVVRE